MINTNNTRTFQLFKTNSRHALLCLLISHIAQEHSLTLDMCKDHCLHSSRPIIFYCSHSDGRLIRMILYTDTVRLCVAIASGLYIYYIAFSVVFFTVLITIVAAFLIKIYLLRYYRIDIDKTMHHN